MHLGQPCVGVTLGRHRPPVYHLRLCQELGKAVGLAERKGRGSMRAHHSYVPAVLLEHRRKIQRRSLTEGRC